MTDDLIPIDRVAEGLWQTITGKDDQGLAAHQAWIALPKSEKEPWRKRAKVAIADWKRA